MKLAPLDLAIVAVFFALTIGLGLFFARNAKRSMADYFVAHRSIPWWLAGTTMVATTFSTRAIPTSCPVELSSLTMDWR